MSSSAALVITGLAEVATLRTGPVPRRGAAMSEIDRIENAAIAVDRGSFVYVGKERRLKREVRLRSGGTRWDASGAVAVPGFVDAHTHLLFGGDRSHEIALKLAGKSYTEIAAGGGGLFATVRATRRASAEALRRSALQRLAALAASGVTTAEVKSGYALDHAGELRLLGLIPSLARRSRLSIVPTYLGAHAIPPEAQEHPESYVDEMVDRTLPEVARRSLAEFCDVFCEPGFYSVEQSARILRAAGKLGLGVKVHAEEFAWSGGARLAAELGARSAEHLLRSTKGDWAAMRSAGVTAVLLPVTPFASLSPDRSPGRELVDADVPVALGSDLSPNSWVESMPSVLTHAVYSARLTPVEALSAATVNAAHAIGRSTVSGRISEGRSADFSVFDLPSVEHIAYRMGSRPVRVYRQGKSLSSR